MPTDGPLSLRSLDPPLRARVVAFNLLALHDVHPERLAGVAPDLPAAHWERLRASRRVAGRLSRWLLARHGLADSFCWEFETPLRRLALLDLDGLRRVAQICGLLIYAEAIRRLIARGPLAALKAEIGVDGHAFAVKRAAFLRLPVRRSAASADLGPAVLADGLSCLAAWLAEEPRAVSLRVALKFPPGTALEAPDPELHGPLGRLVLDRALREGGPLWQASSV
jgi:hypothetical protein